MNLLPVDRLARVNNGRRIVRDRRPVTSGYGTSHVPRLCGAHRLLDDVHFKCGFTDSDYPNPLKVRCQPRRLLSSNCRAAWLAAREGPDGLGRAGRIQPEYIAALAERRLRPISC